MSWHNFSDGVEYDVEEIISVLEQRLASGKVEDIEGKKKIISHMSKRNGCSAVYAPKSVAYGLSPFNLNSWEDRNGEPFFEEQ